MISMAAKRILCILMVDGKEVFKKPIHASTVLDAEEEVLKLCLTTTTLKRERVLVYDRELEDYVDVDEHIMEEKDKVIFHFNTPAPASPKLAPTLGFSAGVHSVVNIDDTPGPSARSEEPPISSSGDIRCTGQSTLKIVNGKKTMTLTPPPTSASSDDDNLREISKIFG